MPNNEFIEKENLKSNSDDELLSDVEAIALNLEDIEERLRPIINLSNIEIKIKTIVENSFESEIHTFSASAGGEDVEVLHSLGRIPSGYTIIRKNANYNVYDGAQAWTTSKIYIRTTGALNGSILIY